MEEGFRTFDHTGDLGLEVWAETPERLYGLAAVAVMAQIAQPIEIGVDTTSVTDSTAPGSGDTGGHDEAPLTTGPLELEGSDPVDLLVHWLNTALLRSDLQHALWTGARVERLTRTSIVATLEGSRLDSRRQVFLREIKAVSHHFLALELEPPRCRCRLILDL